jgi:hypothetical protein
MSKTDELIKKISDFNVELLGIINYLDENSIIYGVGQLEALQEDMQKLLESEISSLKEQIKKEETLLSNVKKDKLKGIIREVIWQYCYGKGGTDALFNYKDIEAVVHDVTELYFQPE